MADEVETKPLA